LKDYSKPYDSGKSLLKEALRRIRQAESETANRPSAVIATALI
jgi:hypothetical protein